MKVSHKKQPHPSVTILRYLVLLCETKPWGGILPKLLLDVPGREAARSKKSPSVKRLQGGKTRKNHLDHLPFSCHRWPIIQPSGDSSTSRHSSPLWVELCVFGFGPRIETLNHIAKINIVFLCLLPGAMWGGRVLPVSMASSPPHRGETKGRFDTAPLMFKRGEVVCVCVCVCVCGVGSGAGGGGGGRGREWLMSVLHNGTKSPLNLN